MVWYHRTVLATSKLDRVLDIVVRPRYVGSYVAQNWTDTDGHMTDRKTSAAVHRSFTSAATKIDHFDHTVLVQYSSRLQ